MAGLKDCGLQIADYLEALEKEIDHYKAELGEQDIKTIYFGGGTPNIIGFEGLQRIIQKIQQTRNMENLAELSLEFNPYPQDQIFDLIKKLNKAYKDFPRVRFSFGIQSLDDEILKRAGRPYNFVGMTQFLRGLRDLKQENNIFNFDFIAFGKFKANGELRDKTRLDFFTKFIQSQFADSFSLYTLEQHQGTARDIRKEALPDDENIMKEFEILKKKISNFGYQRYEISNFCRRGCASVHNMVYWNMEDYLGLGVSASSFIHNSLSGIGKQESVAPDKQIPNKPINQAVRWTNTNNLEQYIQGKRRDEEQGELLSQEDILIESFFLKLRTAEGITDISRYREILVATYESLLMDFQKAGLVVFDGTKLHLTDAGMDVSNSIITDLLTNL